MKKINKLLISLTSSLLIAGNVLALGSCGGSTVIGVQTGDVDAVAYDGSDVTIKFYHCMGAALQTILDDAIKEFNTYYPKIKVLHTSYGDYPGVRDQVTKELKAGIAPSLAYCYPDHVALYQKQKAVLDLDEHIASTEMITRADGTTEQMGLTQTQIDDYVPFYYEEGKMYGDGKMYTLPMLKSTELMYYNKTYFEENKLEIPEVWTWDYVEETCEKILAIESAKEGGLKSNPCYPLGYDSGANWFITMTEQLKSGYTTNEKGNYFTFNNETNQKFVERFRDWYQKGYVTTEEIFGSYTSDLFTQTDKSKTKIFMCIGSSAGATYQTPDPLQDKSYPFEVGVAMIPQENPEDPKMISQGPSICLFKKENDQETAAAWLFAKFITGTVEYQARWSMNNGYTCAIQSVRDDNPNNPYNNFLNKADGGAYLQASAVKLTMDFKDYYFVSPAFVGSSAARDEMALLMQYCFQKTPAKGQTAADLIKSEFEESYKTLKRKYDK